VRKHLGWKNLFLLGLVAEKDCYGYELKKLLIDYYNFHGITMTTIYRSLKMAERNGWLQGQPRPGEKNEQYLYSITPAGREKLAQEVAYYLATDELCLLREFNTALRFRCVLSEDEVRRALTLRRQKLTEKIERAKLFLDGADPSPGGHESAKHAHDHRVAERDWIDRYLSGIK